MRRRVGECRQPQCGIPLKRSGHATRKPSTAPAGDLASRPGEGRQPRQQSVQAGCRHAGVAAHPDASSARIDPVPRHRGFAGRPAARGEPFGNRMTNAGVPWVETLTMAATGSAIAGSVRILPHSSRSRPMPTSQRKCVASWSGSRRCNLRLYRMTRPAKPRRTAIFTSSSGGFGRCIDPLGGGLRPLEPARRRGRL